MSRVDQNSVNVVVTTCMGKSHYKSIWHFSRAYGDSGDKLIFVDDANLSPHIPSEERMKSIVPNTEIPTLLKHEPCCKIVVECANCKDAQLRWEFTPPFTVHEDHSIDYNEMSLYINDLKE